LNSILRKIKRNKWRTRWRRCCTSNCTCSSRSWWSCIFIVKDTIEKWIHFWVLSYM